VGTNWSTGTIPNAAGTDAIVNVASADVFIAGGSSDTVGTLTIDTTSFGVFVGSSDYAAGGTGTLTATTINDTSGVLAGGIGGVINAGSMNVQDAGGGGTFNVTGAINDAGGSLVADGGAYSGGTLVINAGSITGGGLIEDTDGSSLELNAPTSQMISVNAIYGGTTAALQLDSVNTYTGSIDIAAGSTLDLTLTGGTITGNTIIGNTLVVTQGGTSESVVFTPASSITLGGNLFLENAPVCFARGTRIATPDGDVAIESLKKGDLVLTVAGKARPVIWIGHRRADCSRYPDPRKAWPILIQAGAFGPGLPARDLRVSPQHGIFAEGVLIPAKILVNGTTIRQEKVASIEYFHIELESHDILLAEGLPAETYLDAGDRSSFENGGGPVALYPDFARYAWDARACADLKVIGAEVERVRAQLATQARALAPAQREMATA
jgi:hypothetical protein